MRWRRRETPPVPTASDYKRLADWHEAKSNEAAENGQWRLARHHEVEQARAYEQYAQLRWQR